MAEKSYSDENSELLAQTIKYMFARTNKRINVLVSPNDTVEKLNALSSWAHEFHNTWNPTLCFNWHDGITDKIEGANIIPVIYGAPSGNFSRFIDNNNVYGVISISTNAPTCAIHGVTNTATFLVNERNLNQVIPWLKETQTNLKGTDHLIRIVPNKAQRWHRGATIKLLSLLDEIFDLAQEEYATTERLSEFILDDGWGILSDGITYDVDSFNFAELGEPRLSIRLKGMAILPDVNLTMPYLESGYIHDGNIIAKNIEVFLAMHSVSKEALPYYDRSICQHILPSPCLSSNQAITGDPFITNPQIIRMFVCKAKRLLERYEESGILPILYPYLSSDTISSMQYLFSEGG